MSCTQQLLPWLTGKSVFKFRLIHSKTKKVSGGYRYLRVGFCASRVPSKVSRNSPLTQLIACSSHLHTMPAKEEFKRLPSTVSPKHYKLFVKPDLEKLVFEGTVAIDLNVSMNYLSSCYPLFHILSLYKCVISTLYLGLIFIMLSRCTSVASASSV